MSETSKVITDARLTEQQLASIVSQFVKEIAKENNFSIDMGYGGTLDEWKSTDLKYSDGLVLVFTLKKKESTDMVLERSVKGKQFRIKLDDKKHYQCFTLQGQIGCSHNINDKCTHFCHSQKTKDGIPTPEEFRKIDKMTLADMEQETKRRLRQ